MRILVLLISGLLGLILLGIFIKLSVDYYKKKEFFINFLSVKGDMETLYKIGQINKYGIDEKRRVMFFTVSSWLLSKYKETKEVEYFDYEDSLCKYVKVQITFLLGIFISFSVFSVYLTN